MIKKMISKERGLPGRENYMSKGSAAENHDVEVKHEAGEGKSALYPCVDRCMTHPPSSSSRKKMRSWDDRKHILQHFWLLQAFLL